MCFNFEPSAPTLLSYSHYKAIRFSAPPAPASRRVLQQYAVLQIALTLPPAALRSLHPYKLITPRPIHNGFKRRRQQRWHEAQDVDEI